MLWIGEQPVGRSGFTSLSLSRAQNFYLEAGGGSGG